MHGRFIELIPCFNPGFCDSILALGGIYVYATAKVGVKLEWIANPKVQDSILVIE